uniref:Uncharacterized protein n=1 Tax=Glossina pallidipes TaxID=7398 RepID=A0A1A9Z0S4_GLOPL
ISIGVIEQPIQGPCFPQTCAHKTRQKLQHKYWSNRGRSNCRCGGQPYTFVSRNIVCPDKEDVADPANATGIMKVVCIRFKLLFNANFILYVGEVLNQQVGREGALIYLIRLLGEDLEGLKEEYSAAIFDIIVFLDAFEKIDGKIPPIQKEWQICGTCYTNGINR